MISPLEIARRQLTLMSSRIYSLPIVVLMPHSRCNCRCVMGDIWKAKKNGRELSSGERAPHVDAFRRMNIEEVEEFAQILEEIIDDEQEAFSNGFIAESPEKLRRIPLYFAALNGGRSSPRASVMLPECMP